MPQPFIRIVLIHIFWRKKKKYDKTVVPRHLDITKMLPIGSSCNFIIRNYSSDIFVLQ